MSLKAARSVIFHALCLCYSSRFLTGTQGSADRNSFAELGGGAVQPVELPGAAAVSFRKHLPGRIRRPQNR